MRTHYFVWQDDDTMKLYPYTVFKLDGIMITKIACFKNLWEAGDYADFLERKEFPK
jgi:hypothetical protein